MKVSDLFRRLSYGELSNLSMSNDANGTIVDKAQGKLITAANEALLALYSRFLLKKRDVVIQMQEGVTDYYLDSKFSETGAVPDSGITAYILDADNPFLNDAIKVLEVRDHYGRLLPLNDQNKCGSVFTPEPTTIQVAEPQPTYLMTVRYQARHPVLELGILTADIKVPAVLEAALTKHIAYQVYSGMNGQENTAKAQEYLGLFDSLCEEAKNNDLVNIEGHQTNTRFEQGGWC